MNDDWISVLNTIPTNNNPVLVYAINVEQNTEHFAIGSYDAGEWWIGLTCGALTFPHVLKPVYWQPISKP